MISHILEQAWQIYRQHFRVITAVILIIWTPLELLSSYMDAFVFGPDDIRKSWKFAQFLDNFFGIIATAGVIFIGHEALVGRSTTVSSALAVGRDSWGRMWWTRFLSGLAIVLGLVLLIIPGIYLLVRLAFVEPIAVQEQISGPAAMRRSFALTNNRSWLVFRLGLVLVAIFLLPIIAIIGIAMLPGGDYWMIDAAAQLAADVASAFVTIALVTAYSHFKAEPQMAQPPRFDEMQAG